MPHIALEGSTLVIADHRTVDPHARLRFWSFVVLGAALLMFMMVPEFRGSYGPAGMVWPAGVAVTGAAMLLFAGRSRKVLVPLATLDLARGTLAIAEGVSSEFPDVHREFRSSEVAAVVFGMTRFPLPGRATKVDAFSLVVQLTDDSVVPIIEASTEKAAAYKVAMDLAAQLGVPVIQTGLGV